MRDRRYSLHIRQLWFVFLGFMLIFTSLPGMSLPANAATGIEDGGIKQHELFDFEAFIKHDDVIDGTAPFDANSNAGNDSSPNNSIVRSWDTVTYPLKITVNPKKADMLKNIKLKISGTLTNGWSADRVNARFAVGGTEDTAKKEVSFVQEYTIERTGNSIMIPVTIEVLGAKHGVKLTPKITAEIVSVDGVAVTGAATVFNNLPGVTTSAAVSIKAYTGNPLSSSGLPYYPYAGITGNDDDVENIHGFHIAFGVDRLPGKSNIRGATFPDARGKINYTIALSGDVYWDGGPSKGKTEVFNFNGRDTPVMLFDHQPVTTATSRVGAKNMLADGTPYTFRYAKEYTTPYSSLQAKPGTLLDRQRSVLDSGTWDVSAPVKKANEVTYSGSNTGFLVGSEYPIYYGYATTRPFFGVNDKIFSTHGFLVKMPNEYYTGGPNNPNNYPNDVHYKATITLHGYTDENGKTVTFATQQKLSNTFTERNRYVGGPFILQDFISYPGKAVLGTPVVGMGSISKGDASTLIGQDVYYRSRLINSHYPLLGGHRGVYRWNTDAFELTKDYAAKAEASIYSAGYYTLSIDRVQNNKQTQEVLYGVAKFPAKDNEFYKFVQKGIDDYTWYKTYDEAIKKGPVGALQNHVTAPVGAIKLNNPEMPLRVKHENIGIGAKTKNGTENVAVTNFYVYPTKDRKVMVDITSNRSYGNPALWDSSGEMTKIQSPSGSGANFETLAVVPAETAITIASNKATYYNSETIKWTSKNSIKLPQSGVPDNIDAGITVSHILPKGLNYKTGSGKVGNDTIEPEIAVNSNETTTLTWELLVSNSNHTIPTVTFETTINPFALSTNGVHSSVEVTSVISSALDQRPAHLRTTTQSVTVLKVGMVGIYESINKIQGGKNSDYTVTLSPYTTIEDEKGVTGLTHLPLSGDVIGSQYSGSAKISKIEVDANRVHSDKAVKIYLNKNAVYGTKPQNIDVTKNGWYEYTGAVSQLNGAVSLLFYIDGMMTNKDNIEIKVTVQTSNNNFGDQYLNETVINSATDYKLSPVSNRVRYAIRADLELKLERFQIFTNKAGQGLPTSIRVAQVVLDPTTVKDKPITLAIYDKGSGAKVAEKVYTQSELKRENEIKIPATGLTRGSVKNYEVRIEGFDTNKIWVRDGEGRLDTDGHTAKEETLTLDKANGAGDIIFKDVVMTERELGGDIQKFYETLKINKINEPKVKSGYGFGLSAKVEYSNDLMNDVQSKVSGVAFTSDVNAAVHHKLMDKTIEFYDKDAGYTGDDKVPVRLDREDATSTNKIVSSYQLPQVFLERGTGMTYTLNQKENGEIRGSSVDAGHKLYVPVWLDSVGDYGVVFTNKTPMGSHFMNFEIPRTVQVQAYMLNHTDSETPDKDELLIHPMVQDDIPENW